MPQRFEHATFATDRLNSEEFDTLLLTYSEQGWELVSVILTNQQKYMLFFKRPAATMPAESSKLKRN